MKISEMVKRLNTLKKEHGDLEVFVDLKNVDYHGGHCEYTHESEINLDLIKLHSYNADNSTMSKKKSPAIALTICDGLNEDTDKPRKKKK